MIFERIKMFIEAANRQNIAKTADTFHTTKDRIRNQIILLEKEIGYPLFVKTPKGSYLNKDGEIIYHAFNKMLIEYQNALTAIESNHNSSNKIIRIAITNSPYYNFLFALNFSSSELIQYKIKYVELEYVEFYDALIKENVDVCFCHETSQIKNNKSIKLFHICDDQLCLLTNNESILSNQKSIKTKNVKNQTIYYNPKIMTPATKRCINNLKKNNTTVPILERNYNTSINEIIDKSAIFLCHYNYYNFSYGVNQKIVLLDNTQEPYYLICKNSQEKIEIAYSIIDHFNLMLKNKR